jgi:hypothetical protein
LSSFIDDQCEKNLATAGLWDCYRPHRQKIDAILRADVRPGQSLGILGAGNCNDLELADLAKCFRRLSLVDCDEAAMQQARERLSVQVSQGQVSQGVELIGLDVTGCFQGFDEVLQQQRSLSPQDVVATLLSKTVAPPSGSPYDRVASLCLLSQLFDRLSSYLPATDPHFLAALDALRTRHLKSLLQWTRPGGQTLLFLDFVSSDTAPQLRSVSSSNLPSLVEQLFKADNFFTGLHPGAIVAQLRTNSALQPWVEEVTVAAPWIWDIGSRCYAVTCIRMVRSELEANPE